MGIPRNASRPEFLSLRFISFSPQPAHTIHVFISPCAGIGPLRGVTSVLTGNVAYAKGSPNAPNSRQVEVFPVPISSFLLALTCCVCRCQPFLAPKIPKCSLLTRFHPHSCQLACVGSPQRSSSGVLGVRELLFQSVPPVILVT